MSVLDVIGYLLTGWASPAGRVLKLTLSTRVPGGQPFNHIFGRAHIRCSPLPDTALICAHRMRCRKHTCVKRIAM